MTPLRRAAVLALALASHGCTWYVYDASARPIASRIAGRCFVLRERAILSEHFSPFTAYALNLPGANECTPPEVTPAIADEARYKQGGLGLPRCVWVPVANIAEGTMIRVTNVTEQPYGGPGRCWKVDVAILTGRSAGITAAIPACHFDVPGPGLWLRMQSPHAYVEPLELSERVVAPCPP